MSPRLRAAIVVAVVVGSTAAFRILYTPAERPVPAASSSSGGGILDAYSPALEKASTDLVERPRR